jgi:hypothetical protein
MKSDALIEQVLDSPELPFALDRLQAVLEAERPLRERFYEEITPEGKFEFIKGKVVVQPPAALKHRGRFFIKGFSLPARAIFDEAEANKVLRALLTE